MAMSIRRFMTFASFVLVLACHREQNTQTATATSAKKTGTVAGAPVDLRHAKVKTTITTAEVLQTTDSRLGNHANPEGMVILESNEFKPGEPVILSMKVQQSPNGLQMRAVWKDAKGKILEEDRKTMNGQKVATFAYSGKKLAPGDYTVTGYWGGNVASEKKFKVAN